MFISSWFFQREAACIFITQIWAQTLQTPLERHVFAHWKCLSSRIHLNLYFRLSSLPLCFSWQSLQSLKSNGDFSFDSVRIRQFWQYVSVLSHSLTLKWVYDHKYVVLMSQHTQTRKSHLNLILNQNSSFSPQLPGKSSPSPAPPPCRRTAFTEGNLIFILLPPFVLALHGKVEFERPNKYSAKPKGTKQVSVKHIPGKRPHFWVAQNTQTPVT